MGRRAPGGTTPDRANSACEGPEVQARTPVLHPLGTLPCTVPREALGRRGAPSFLPALRPHQHRRPQRPAARPGSPGSLGRDRQPSSPVMTTSSPSSRNVLVCPFPRSMAFVPLHDSSNMEPKLSGSCETGKGRECPVPLPVEEPRAGVEGPRGPAETPSSRARGSAPRLPLHSGNVRPLPLRTRGCGSGPRREGRARGGRGRATARWGSV